jgi:hypothetical protein
MSEKLLHCKDAPEFISYSEWESEAAIKAYRNSEAHKEIVRHARALKRAKGVARGCVSKRSHSKAGDSRPPHQRSMPPVPPFLSRSGREGVPAP